MPLELEELRSKFRPDDIRLLFVGESPPPGKGFFYMGRSTLFDHTASVFQERCHFPAQGEAFLRAFADAGCYLEDLFLERGAKVADQTPATRASASERMSTVIKSAEPDVVIGVLLSIENSLRDAIKGAGTETPLRVLPFPYHKSPERQAAYREGLADVIEQWGCG